MICTYLRSSLLNAFDMCQQRAFIEYGIGRKQPPNKAALQGTCLHAVCETLALEKLAEQNKQILFTQEQFGTSKVGFYDSLFYLSKIYPALDKENPGVFDGNSYNECLKLVKKMESYNDGMMNPKNANIFGAEVPVNIEIQKPWATYDFHTPTQELQGQLTLKGTIDLIVKQGDGVIEVVDYKSGSKTDWATGKTKDEQSLYNDTQIRLYHYAACLLFPEIECVLFSLYFVKFDEVFTIALDRKHLPETELMLQRKFKKIVECTKPTLSLGFKCRFCPFDKSIEPDGKTTCVSFRDKIIVDGMPKTMKDNADFYALTRYGAGGSNRDRE
jgi:hypothetical protein